MELDFIQLTPQQRYKLLAGLIVPRPIALVTSRDAEGNLNAAPFSFFNCVGSDPALVILSVGNRAADTPKDTAANIETTGAFVVNMVDEPMAERMNATAGPFPPEVNELDEVGFASADMPGIDIPRIAESPASFACRHHSTQHIGNNRIILGEVTAAFVRDGLVDPASLRVDVTRLTMVGRMASPGWYCRTTDRFELDRP
ncbi:MAG: flavin reductase family protein [Planctomycetota bacterium]